MAAAVAILEFAISIEKGKSWTPFETLRALEEFY
jgi:hypothetical protein